METVKETISVMLWRSSKKQFQLRCQKNNFSYAVEIIKEMVSVTLWRLSKKQLQLCCGYCHKQFQLCCGDCQRNHYSYTVMIKDSHTDYDRDGKRLDHASCTRKEQHIKHDRETGQTYAQFAGQIKRQLDPERHAGFRHLLHRAQPLTFSMPERLQT